MARSSQQGVCVTRHLANVRIWHLCDTGEATLIQPGGTHLGPCGQEKIKHWESSVSREGRQGLWSGSRIEELFVELCELGNNIGYIYPAFKKMPFQACTSPATALPPSSLSQPRFWRVYPCWSHLLPYLLLFGFYLLSFINCCHQGYWRLPCWKQNNKTKKNRSFSVLFNLLPSFDMF